jgi:hypothetical protein
MITAYKQFILETKTENGGQVTSIYLSNPEKTFVTIVFTSDLDQCNSIQLAKHKIDTNFQKETKVPTVAELKAQQKEISEKY